METNDIPFSDDELLQMIEMQRPNELWSRAFTYFNSQNTQKYNMGCRSCFGKVLRFIMEKRLS